MRRHRVVEVLVGHVLERPHLDDAGVVHEDVDRAPLIDDGVDRGAYVGTPADVAAQREDRCATGLEVDPRAVQLVDVAREQTHARPFVGEHARHDETESARAAGDDDHPARERDPPARAREPHADERRARTGRQAKREHVLSVHQPTSNRRRSVTASRGACPPTSLLKYAYTSDEPSRCAFSHSAQLRSRSTA